MSDPRQRSNPIIFFVFVLRVSGALWNIRRRALHQSLQRVGPPTSRILVSGSGFEPNVGVDIFFFDTKDKTLIVTNGKGEFHDARIYAPGSAHPGEHWVTALEME